MDCVLFGVCGIGATLGWHIISLNRTAAALKRTVVFVLVFSSLPLVLIVGRSDANQLLVGYLAALFVAALSHVILLDLLRNASR
jgi:hypothetical protein